MSLHINDDNFGIDNIQSIFDFNLLFHRSFLTTGITNCFEVLADDWLKQLLDISAQTLFEIIW